MTARKETQRLKTLYEANAREVTRLSWVVADLSAKLREAKSETESWKRRFDRLLEIR